MNRERGSGERTKPPEANAAREPNATTMTVRYNNASTVAKTVAMTTVAGERKGAAATGQRGTNISTTVRSPSVAGRGPCRPQREVRPGRRRDAGRSDHPGRCDANSAWLQLSTTKWSAADVALRLAANAQSSGAAEAVRLAAVEALRLPGGRGPTVHERRVRHQISAQFRLQEQ